MTMTEASAPKINWPVFVVSALAVVGIVLWAVIGRESAAATLTDLTQSITASMGWFYIATATVVFVFVVFLGASTAGTIRLGPDDSRPQFSLFSWSAMLFAAGIGVDLMFFAVAEPVIQYLDPPELQGETAAAARQAVVWALFHYGISGWAMYALMGAAFGYFAYRLNMPLAIRSALSPLMGRRIDGFVGNSVDIAAVLGTIFGIAASLGIGVVQISYGVSQVTGWAVTEAMQAALVVVGVGMATLSAVSGVDKGIRRLSEVNVILAILLVAYVAATGQVSFLLRATITNLGDYVVAFPSLALNTFPYSADPVHTQEWMSAWTVFFWAWWVAWSPFVGLFLARISRGRTLREFVFGTLLVPFFFIVAWMGVFGNAALRRVLDGDSAFATDVVEQPEKGFYDLLGALPGGSVLIVIATVIGLLLYVTSADSGALVTANFSSRIEHNRQDGSRWVRVFWAVVVGGLTLVMLRIDGVTTVQYATIVMGLPFAFVMYLIMAGLWKSIRADAAFEQPRRGPETSFDVLLASAGQPWPTRLTRAMTWPSEAKARSYLDDVATPALRQLAAEIAERDGEAVVEASASELAEVQLRIPVRGESDFVYRIVPVLSPLPSFSLNTGEEEMYCRLEAAGAQENWGYDVFGYPAEQLINDAVLRYEQHLERITGAG